MIFNRSNHPDDGPIKIAPKLPHAALPDADWADTFEQRTERQFASMRELADITVGSFPAWVEALMAARNVLVAPFALKRDGTQDAPQRADRIGIFPVIGESVDQMILGMDDFHLDFRIVIDRLVAARGGGDLLHVTTLVKRNNFLGRAYLAAVMPFHKLIVPVIMRQAG